MSIRTLTGQQVADEGLDGWVLLVDRLQTRIRTGDFATGLALVNLIGEAAERMDHHPDLDLRYTHLDVRLQSHDARGVTERDVRLARSISSLAGEAGVALESATVARLELALDSPAYGSVLPFWAAVLGMEHQAPVGADDELRDPYGELPTIWFQESGSEEPRQRWHLDVWVDPSQVQARIDAAFAAGGRLVTDEPAPSFWILADAEGNQVCLCTWQDRE